MRISEFCGVTKDDIDFEDNKIRVDHQLQRKRDMEYVIETPKTEKGVRYVPMSDEVRECFKRILEKRKKPKIEPMIDGKCGFLYLDKNNSRWLLCIGRNTFNISVRSIIRFTRKNFQ